jgi:hypothetical protein
LVTLSWSSLRLRVPVGSFVTVVIDSNTIVRIQGTAATIDRVHRLEVATTVTVDGGPAALVNVRIPPRVAAVLAGGGG